MRLSFVSRSFIAVAALALFTTIGASASITRPVGLQAVHHNMGAAHLTIRSASVRPNVTCPTEFIACFTVSAASGAVINWCYGPSSSPCSQTNTVLWSGIVCAEGTDGGAACGGTTDPDKTEEMHSKWTGPFACNSTVCGTNPGTYEVDTIKTEAGVKQNTKYVYEENIHICLVSNPTSCSDYEVGLNVGP
jgi:hypothetical protein